MTPPSDYIFGKEQALEKYLAFHLSRAAPAGVPVPAGTSLKLYFYEPGIDLVGLQQDLYLLDEEMYPEDFGTFVLLNRLLKKHFATQNADEADFIVFPFNVYFHDRIDYGWMGEEVDRARRVNPGRRLILFSLCDFCLRPKPRAMPFERQLFPDPGLLSQYSPPWLLPSDVLLNFEATLDFVFRDVSVFPLVKSAVISPAGNDRTVLYSFVGSYCKSNWPDGFVRSPSRQPVWEKLKQQDRALIVELTDADFAARGSTFLEIPARSHFTLCPRGIASWTFRLYEAILSGSIPVILSDSFVGPFPEQLAWRSFSVSLPETCLGEVDAILGSIDPETTAVLKANLAANQHWFTPDGLVRLIATRLHRMARK
jgi:hypothetical protein